LIGYLFMTARGLCSRRRTSATARRFVDVEVDEARIVDDALSPEEDYGRREELAARKRAVDTLPDHVRRTVSLLLEGKSQREAARELGLSDSAIHAHVLSATEYLTTRHARREGIVRPQPRARRKRRAGFEYQGRAVTLAEVAKITGLTASGLHRRLSAGMTLAEAVETPAKNTGKRRAAQAA
jgi:hypothetical protein